MNVISFQEVSKKYKLYSKGGLYLRDRITHALQRLNPLNGGFAAHRAKSIEQSAAPSAPSAMPSAPSATHPLERDFWALKNVSFEIKQGESVGFIGRNGAGKSTILKLLAGVTKPSSGNVEVVGRVAALIEVGAGFHPELTGRENVFLNASILGMKKAEIEKQFDSIVSFAELEEFIDTPVKHYSSGMYVRLGFAIAAHTEPDIFLIDEVLAVGDAAFQKKCTDTLAAHKAAGKTMILVSHDLEKIAEVCDRCIYVSHGEVRYDGLPSEAITEYQLDVRSNPSVRKSGEKAPFHLAEILDVIFYESHGQKSFKFETGDDLTIEIRYRAESRIANPVFGIAIHGPNDAHVTGFNSRTTGRLIEFIEGESSIFCCLSRLCLNEGVYWVSVSLHDFDGAEVYDFHQKQYKLTVGKARKHIYGLVTLPAEWAWNQSGTQKLASLRDASISSKVG
jgi:ABC-type polysaccharide/polyol phosphate transport system ATPase subunit